MECDTITLNHCQQLCVNDAGTYSCACRDGYLLHDDGGTCVGKSQLYIYIYIQYRGSWKQGLDLDVRRPSSGGARVGFGPVVVVADLWSR